MLALGGRARRPHPAAGPRRQLLAVRPHRSLRPVLGDLLRPGSRLRGRGRPAGRRHRALPRDLEPRVHAVRAPGRRLAARAAHAEHRHRHGAGAHVVRAAGRRVGLRDRPLPAAGGPGRGAQRPPLRAGLPHHAGAAHPGRPRARRHVPARRRGRSLQRGPGLHPAPHHAPHDAAGSRARAERALPASALRAGGGGHGRRLPRPPERVAGHRALGPGRGGGLRSHPRAGRKAPGRPDRAGAARRRPPGWRPRTPSGCTTPTAFPTR